MNAVECLARTATVNDVGHEYVAWPEVGYSPPYEIKPRRVRPGLTIISRHDGVWHCMPNWCPSEWRAWDFWTVAIGLDHPELEDHIVGLLGVVPPQGEPDWPLIEITWEGGTSALRVLIYFLKSKTQQGFVSRDSRPEPEHRFGGIVSLSPRELRAVKRAAVVWTSVAWGKRPRGPKPRTQESALKEFGTALALALESDNATDLNDFDRTAIADKAAISRSRLDHVMADLDIRNKDVIASALDLAKSETSAVPNEKLQQ